MTLDPMLKVSSQAQRALFESFCQAANGFSTEAVVGAAINVLVNAIRQSQPTKHQAEKRFDELFGQTKQVLINHYDSVGRKKGIFPYDQTIHATLFVDEDKFGGN